MIGKIVRYLILILVVVGGVFLVGALINKSNNKDIDKKDTYSVNIRVMDRETKEALIDGEFVLKTKDGKALEKWTMKDKVKTIDGLSNGTYVIVQNSASDGYEVSDSVTFKIYNDDKDVTIYNDMVIEEVIEVEEVMVDNTLSMKSSISYVISVVIIGIGVLLVNKKFALSR